MVRGMEAQIDRSVFAEEASWVSRSVPPRPTNLIYAGLLIEAEGEQLRLSGADGSKSSTTTIDADITVPGSVVVPGRLLAKIADSLPQKPVIMKLNGTRLAFTCGKTTFELPTSPLELYPKPPDQPDRIGSLPGQEFSDAIWQVGIAAAKEDAQPFLTGIQLKCTDTHITMIATDRYRLAVKRVPWKGTVREPFLLRGKTLGELSRPVSPTSVHLSLDPGTTLFGVTMGTRRSTMQMLDGERYPDIERMVPTAGALTVTFDVAELVESVKRVRLVMQNPNQSIRCTFGNDEIHLSAGTDASNANASETIDATITGDRMEIAFNPEYLVEGLAALAGETGRFQLNTPAKPVLLDAPEDPSYKYVLMPVRLDK